MAPRARPKLIKAVVKKTPAGKVPRKSTGENKKAAQERKKSKGRSKSTDDIGLQSLTPKPLSEDALKSRVVRLGQVNCRPSVFHNKETDSLLAPSTNDTQLMGKYNSGTSTKTKLNVAAKRIRSFPKIAVTPRGNYKSKPENKSVKLPHSKVKALKVHKISSQKTKSVKLPHSKVKALKVHKISSRKTKSVKLPRSKVKALKVHKISSRKTKSVKLPRSKVKALKVHKISSQKVKAMLLKGNCISSKLKTKSVGRKLPTFKFSKIESLDEHQISVRSTVHLKPLNNKCYWQPEVVLKRLEQLMKLGESNTANEDQEPNNVQHNSYDIIETVGLVRLNRETEIPMVAAFKKTQQSKVSLKNESLESVYAALNSANNAALPVVISGKKGDSNIHKPTEVANSSKPHAVNLEGDSTDSNNISVNGEHKKSSTPSVILNKTASAKVGKHIRNDHSKKTEREKSITPSASLKEIASPVKVNKYTLNGDFERTEHKKSITPSVSVKKVASPVKVSKHTLNDGSEITEYSRKSMTPSVSLNKIVLPMKVNKCCTSNENTFEQPKQSTAKTMSKYNFDHGEAVEEPMEQESIISGEKPEKMEHDVKRKRNHSEHVAEKKKKTLDRLSTSLSPQEVAVFSETSKEISDKTVGEGSLISTSNETIHRSSKRSKGEKFISNRRKKNVEDSSSENPNAIMSLPSYDTNPAMFVGENSNSGTSDDTRNNTSWNSENVQALTKEVKKLQQSVDHLQANISSLTHTLKNKQSQIKDLETKLEYYESNNLHTILKGVISEAAQYNRVFNEQATACFIVDLLVAYERGQQTRRTVSGE